MNRRIVAWQTNVSLCCYEHLRVGGVLQAFLIIPFMDFLLPVAVKLFPGMLPSTFQARRGYLHVVHSYMKSCQPRTKLTLLIKHVSNSKPDNGERHLVVSAASASSREDRRGETR